MPRRWGELFSIRSIVRQIALPVILVLGVVIMLSAMQRQLIYFPGRASEPDLLAAAERIGLQGWRDTAGELIGWKSIASPDAKNRILVFHGNAGFALDRGYFLSGLQALGSEWEVLLFEYPGYGARQGKPSAKTIKSAATRALKSLWAVDSRPVYLLGESLGSGVASYLAGAFPERVAGLLLVTPFTSLADVAAHHYSFLPVRALLTERYESVESLSRFRGPAAFLLAGRDEVVTTELGQQLYDRYSGPKWIRIEANAGHNTLPYHPGAPWWREASGFLTQIH